MLRVATTIGRAGTTPMPGTLLIPISLTALTATLTAGNATLPTLHAPEPLPLILLAIGGVWAFRQRRQPQS
jgi:hypothetical protein